MAFIRAFLIRLLFRLIDTIDARHDEKMMQVWLSMSWQDQGFKNYVAERDKKMVRELAGGIGMATRKRDEYVQMIGQRFELLRFAHVAKLAYEKRKKELQNRE
jgi:hypothetical protein